MIKFPLNQPDFQLKLKLHQENLLKKFTKQSFNYKIKKAQKEEFKAFEFQSQLEAHKIATGEVEGMIMERLKSMSPRKKLKKTEILNSQIKSISTFKKMRSLVSKNPSDIMSASDFVKQVTSMPVKFLGESLDFKQEYNKKVGKLNDLFTENITSYNNFKNLNKSYHSSHKISPLFKNNILNKVLINQTNSEKKQPDSIQPVHKCVDLEINQIKNNQSNIFGINYEKKRAQSAYNNIYDDNNNFTTANLTETLNDNLKIPHYNFNQRFYRMQDLDKLLAKSLIISEKINSRENKENKFLRGALKNSSNLNYHMEAVMRSIERGGKLTQNSKITTSQIELYKEKILQNFRKLKTNTKKMIQEKVKSIDKMLFTDSKTLEYRSPNLKRPESVKSGKKFKKRLELRSKVMQQSKILEISKEHSALSKKSRIISSNNNLTKNMNYVNYFL